jgi:hypothetical protein
MPKAKKNKSTEIVKKILLQCINSIITPKIPKNPASPFTNQTKR